MSKKFDLQKYKATIKATELPYKKQEFIKTNEALQEVMGLEGIPLGHILQVYGPPNGGKTSLALHVAGQAQKQGVLPIFVITEDKLSTERASAMGVNLDQAIICHATYVEDIFKHIDTFMVDQSKGELPMDILFIVDSIGNTISETSVTINKDGTTEVGGAMMKVSKILRENMRIMSHKINDTRRVNSPKTATLLFINHSYTKPPAFPGAMSTDECYGGSGISYAASIIIKVKKSKMLKATKNGKDVTFGILSKLSVEKNHINGVSNSGEFAIVPDDLIANESGAIKDYKDRASDSWGTFSTDDGEELEE
jgi:recombination protein RecA